VAVEAIVTGSSFVQVRIANALVLVELNEDA
jgi:hypothetical protein